MICHLGAGDTVGSTAGKLKCHLHCGDIAADRAATNLPRCHYLQILLFLSLPITDTSASFFFPFLFFLLTCNCSGALCAGHRKMWNKQLWPDALGCFAMWTLTKKLLHILKIECVHAHTCTLHQKWFKKLCFISKQLLITWVKKRQSESSSQHVIKLYCASEYCWLTNKHGVFFPEFVRFKWILF